MANKRKIRKLPDGGKVKDKAKLTSNTNVNIGKNMFGRKMKQYGLPEDWINLNEQAFPDSLQTRYPGQFHLPLKIEDGEYLQNFARWNKGQPVLDPRTGKMNEIPEMSLGGIAASMGSGALGGAAIAPPWGAIGGAAIGLVKGLIGHKAEKDQEKGQESLLAEQERLEQERKDLATNEYQSSNTFASNYMPTFAQGGTVGGELVELEKNEITVGPDGSVKKYDLPSHAYATPNNVKDLAYGTKVYSDKLKTSTGVTFAEAADEILKKIKRINNVYKK